MPPVQSTMRSSPPPDKRAPKQLKSSVLSSSPPAAGGAKGKRKAASSTPTAPKRQKLAGAGGGKNKRKAASPTPKRQKQPPIPTTKPTIFDKRDAPGIKAHLETFGYAVVRVLDDAGCKKAIEDQIRHILLKQPWIQKLEVRDRATGAVLDIDRDTDRYITELITPDIPVAARAHYGSVWTMHKTFGACCDPNAFHLPMMWDVRQNGDLYEVMSSVLEKKEIYVTIDRCIHKLPGEGEAEFLHWDVPIFRLRDAGSGSFPGVFGKVMFTDGTFVCVPGTHTRDFADRFKAQYQPFYPKAKDTDAKFGLDERKPDPMNLRSQRQSIALPAGCAIFWSRYLLHGTEKSPVSSGIEFGMYLGYMTNIDRPKYTYGEERQDRRDSYMHGRAPLMYPSLDPTHYYPKNLKNFPHVMQAYVDRTPADYVGRSTRMVETGSLAGTLCNILVPVPDKDYVPCALTLLGLRLLGIEPW